jgi:hypothetical protein
MSRTAFWWRRCLAVLEENQYARLGWILWLIIAVFPESKDHRMSFVRIAATAGVGLFLGLAPAPAAPIYPAALQTSGSHDDVEHIRYRHRHYNDAAVGAAIIGGIISGVIGGALGGSCYYNDCGYGGGYYYGGYGGGGRGFRGGRGGGGGHFNVGHASGAGGHGRH